MCCREKWFTGFTYFYRSLFSCPSIDILKKVFVNFKKAFDTPYLDRVFIELLNTFRNCRTFKKDQSI